MKEVESLLHQKCVCKQWLALIRNPEFKLDHLDYQKRYNKGRLLLQCSFNDEPPQHVYVLFDDKTLASDTYHDLIRLSCSLLDIKGPVNGLYCLFNGTYKIVLWNPTLKKFLIVPSPHAHFFLHVGRIALGGIGFGINPLTHDLNIIVILRFADEEFEFMTPSYVMVYNLTTNTWRLLYDLGYTGFFKDWSLQSYAVLNGIYYWGGSTFDAVVRFDMGKETFRVIKSFPYCTSPSTVPRTTDCTLYKDKVAMVAYYTLYADIWVMMQESEWEKHLSFTSLPEVFSFVGVWRTDGFLFSNMHGDDGISETILCYNHTNQERKTIGPRGGHYSAYQGSVYYESAELSDCEMWPHDRRCISLEKLSEFPQIDNVLIDDETDSDY